MALSAAFLLLAQALPVAPVPQPVVAATASAFVEVLRAERGGEAERPDAMVRQVRRVPGGMLVDFN